MVKCLGYAFMAGCLLISMMLWKSIHWQHTHYNQPVPVITHTEREYDGTLEMMFGVLRIRAEATTQELRKLNKAADAGVSPREYLNVLNDVIDAQQDYIIAARSISEHKTTSVEYTQQITKLRREIPEQEAFLHKLKEERQAIRASLR